MKNVDSFLYKKNILLINYYIDAHFMYHCKAKIFYVEWTSLKCRCSCNKILIYAFRKFFFVQLFHFVFKMILPRINLTFITWHLFKYLRRNCRLLKLEILFSIFTLFAFVRRREFSLQACNLSLQNSNCFCVILAGRSVNFYI